MKRLWKVIDRERRSEGLTAKEMARKLRMDPAHLSRLRTGQLRDLSPESLSYLLAGLRKSPDLHQEVLTAYLSDKLEGTRHVHRQSAKDAAVELLVRETPGAYGTETPPTVTETCVRAGLSRRVAEAIDELSAQALANKRLQALLISLADYGRKE
jgi:transcriptional regulator with XRE-family HTH domain